MRNKTEKQIGEILNRAIESSEEPLHYIKDQDAPLQLDFAIISKKARQLRRRRTLLKCASYAAAVLVCSVPLAYLMTPTPVDADRARMESIYSDGIQHGFAEERPGGVPDNPASLTMQIADEAAALEFCTEKLNGFVLPELGAGYELINAVIILSDDGTWAIRFTYNTPNPDETVEMKQAGEM